MALPEARQDKLLVQEIEDELVVYDQERHRAHLLNRTVTLVWRNCDGKHTVAEIAALLQGSWSLPAAEEALVMLALRRLERAHLLKERGTCPADGPDISRREVTRQLSLAGGFMALVPAITSILVPTPAMAGSCSGLASASCDGSCGMLAPNHQVCMPFKDCPSGLECRPSSSQGGCFCLPPRTP